MKNCSDNSTLRIDKYSPEFQHSLCFCCQTLGILQNDYYFCISTYFLSLQLGRIANSDVIRVHPQQPPRLDLSRLFINYIDFYNEISSYQVKLSWDTGHGLFLTAASGYSFSLKVGSGSGPPGFLTRIKTNMYFFIIARHNSNAVTKSKLLIRLNEFNSSKRSLFFVYTIHFYN